MLRFPKLMSNPLMWSGSIDRRRKGHFTRILNWADGSDQVGTQTPRHFPFEPLPNISQNRPGQLTRKTTPNEKHSVSNQLRPPLATLYLPAAHRALRIFADIWDLARSPNTHQCCTHQPSFQLLLLWGLEWTLREPCMMLSPRHLLLEQRLAELIQYVLKIPLSRIITAGWALLEDNLCWGYLLMCVVFLLMTLFGCSPHFRQCNFVVWVHRLSEHR